MIHKISPTMVVLQEMGTGEISMATFIKKCKDIGYPNVFTVPNGGSKSKSTSFVAVMCKYTFVGTKLDVSVGDTYRCVAMIKYRGLTICGLHLEIGYRFHHITDSTARDAVKDQNVTDRIEELEQLLAADILIGDFNFNPNDPETTFLQEKGYILGPDKTPTTPFGVRTDMVFTRPHIQIRKSHTVKCNYSDHLPVVVEI